MIPTHFSVNINKFRNIAVLCHNFAKMRKVSFLTIKINLWNLVVMCLILAKNCLDVRYTSKFNLFYRFARQKWSFSITILNHVSRLSVIALKLSRKQFIHQIHEVII